MDRDEIERAKFLRFADMLDECFPATHEHEKPGGENIRVLISDRDRLASDLQATRAELERVRRNHIRRMAHTAWLRRDYPRSTPISFRRRGQYDRFAIACIRAALATMEPKA